VEGSGVGYNLRGKGKMGGKKFAGEHRRRVGSMKKKRGRGGLNPGDKTESRPNFRSTKHLWFGSGRGNG